MKIKAKRGYSFIELDGTKLNTCLIEYRITKEKGTFPDTWEKLLAKEETSTDEVDACLDLNLSVESAYIVQIRVSDDVDGNGTPRVFSIPSDKIFLHKKAGGRSLSIGEYVEEDGVVSVAKDIQVRVKGELSLKGKTIEDFVIEVGESNGWKYKKWADGFFEMFGEFSVNTTANSSSLGVLYISEIFEIPTPFPVEDLILTGIGNSYFMPIGTTENSTNSIRFQLVNVVSWTSGLSIKLKLFVKGKYLINEEE